MMCEVTGLRKAYGGLDVLNGVSFSVARGEIFALLGPNGAGKTTTVRILATLTRADGGGARIAGFDVHRDRGLVRREISLTGQYAALDGMQTGEENLRMMGQLVGLSRRQARERARELLVRFELTDAARRFAKTYSGGMRRRLDIAAGLVGEPSVIFLDEPTTGLDPRSRKTMWDIIAELAASGVTIVLTTQYLEEADRLADRITLIDGGRIVAEGTPAELKRLVGVQRLDIRAANREAFSRIAASREHVTADGAALTLSFATDGAARHVRELLNGIDPGNCDVHEFSVHQPTLDDVFLSLTGNAAVKDEARV
ncbi:ATP-binding cassette domain-containing protein [Hoyosella subflava]|uniref:Putative ABC transporter ATP-binding protein n=1 Tax=Hoyosella subflava (strain DSM 45089 / JCM 17490 / NBRC 109087 / DQS3-9A1) TaxID=443218 RepID=F6EM49_HOYSD|nr:ATP-binding cassette domain-containing protein [Hoyosella subflava]AEF39255.1 Putative ABC transporter ATP-binding protein [Hoyosella subflava DQS3-9A1]